MPGQEASSKQPNFSQDFDKSSLKTQSSQIPIQQFTYKQPLFERVQFGIDTPVNKSSLKSNSITNDALNQAASFNQPQHQPLFERVYFGSDKQVTDSQQLYQGKSYWKTIKEKFFVDNKKGVKTGEKDTMVRDIWSQK